MGWEGGGLEPCFFRKLAVTVGGLVFVGLFWLGFEQPALHNYPQYWVHFWGGGTPLP